MELDERIAILFRRGYLYNVGFLFCDYQRYAFRKKAGKKTN
jgi:hypothetical protein